MQNFNSLNDSFNMYRKLSFWQIFALDDILNTAYEIKIVLFQYTYTYHLSFHTITLTHETLNL